MASSGEDRTEEDVANNGCSVRVAVRVRPLIGQELTDRCSECIRVSRDDSRQIVLGKDTCFTFDHVFSKDSGQNEIYNDCVAPLVSAAFEGFNATVLAYGQTGSGKTYTMGSASNMRLCESEQGIIPRVIEEMFVTMTRKREQEPGSVYRVSAQFLEIYGEEIKDLLDLVNSRVTIRENQDGEISVSGAREETVESAEELMMVLERGTLCRTTGSTMMNAQSSRSHAIFTIVLENRTLRSDVGGQQGGEEQFEMRRSKFHFVDLAGSERAKRTGAEGKRLKEGIDINRGLLVLGNVISALGDSKKRGRVHVPYRDSKLTRMLQDSLGGNSQTLMIACVSPAETNLHETLNALRYANRARNIQNKPIVNRDRDSAVIVELKRQVQTLAAELLRIKTTPRSDGSSSGGEDASNVSKDMLESLLAQHTTPGAAVSMGGEGGHGGGPPYHVLLGRLEEAEAEVRRLVEENKKLKAKDSQTSEKLLQCMAEKEFYRLGLGGSTAGNADGTAGEGEGTNSGDGVQNGDAGGEKQSVMDAIRGYLAEIASLKDKNLEAERGRRMLEMRLEHMGTPPYMRMILSRRASGGGEGGAGGDEREWEDLEVDTHGGEVWRVEDRLVPVAESKTGGVKRTRRVMDRSAGEEEEDDETRCGALHVAVLALGRQQQREEEEMKKELLEQEAGASSRRVQEYSMSVAEIDINIEMKEKLMKQLHESQKRYEIMKRFYEEKLKHMDEEVSRFEGERNKLLKEVEEVEKRSEDEQKELHQTLIKKVQEKEAQLEIARKKQEELAQLARVKTRTEAQIRQLTDEIGTMRKQRTDLLKRIDAEKRRFQTVLKEKTTEIENMRRAAKRDAQEIQRLGSVIEKADSARKKQAEDQRRRDNFQRTHRSPGSVGGGHMPSQTQALPTAPSRRYTDVEKKAKKWLDLKIREVAKKEEAAERLAAEYQRRMALLKTKEDLERARNRIFGAGRRSVREMIMTQTPYSPTHHSPHETAKGLGHDAALSADEEATLEELEERIEACRTQLEYKDDRIRKIETVIKSLPDLNGGQVSHIAESCATLEQSHTVIRVLFDMLMTSRRLAKGNGDRVKDLDKEVVRLTRSLEDSETRYKADRRAFQQQLIKQSINYEEKISGLIDHSHLSGLIGTGAVPPPNTPIIGDTEREQEGEEAPGHAPRRSSSAINDQDQGLQTSQTLGTSLTGVVTADQYRCIMKLSNERNQALREQFYQAQAGREDLQMQTEELEARMRRAQEDLREKDDTIKWLEFELTKVRAEYIKLRGPRSAGTTTISMGGGAKGPWLTARKVTSSEELKSLEAEVLGDDDSSEDDEDESDDEEDSVEEEGGGGGGGEEEGGGLERSQDEAAAAATGANGDEVEPAWAKGVTDDIDKHIKAGRVPPIFIAKTRELAERERMVFHSPVTGDREAAVRQQAMFTRRNLEKTTIDMSSTNYSSIFDRLADPQHFTGIHKHVHPEEVAEKRHRVEQIKSKIEQGRYRVRRNYTKGTPSGGTPRPVGDEMGMTGGGSDGDIGLLPQSPATPHAADFDGCATNPRFTRTFTPEESSPPHTHHASSVFTEPGKSLRRAGARSPEAHLPKPATDAVTATGDLIVTEFEEGSEEHKGQEPLLPSGPPPPTAVLELDEER